MFKGLNAIGWVISIFWHLQGIYKHVGTFNCLPSIKKTWSKNHLTPTDGLLNGYSNVASI